MSSTDDSDRVTWVARIAPGGDVDMVMQSSRTESVSATDSIAGTENVAASGAVDDIVG